MSYWKVGDKCYIVVSNYKSVSGVIKNVSGGFCTIRMETGGGIRLRESRLFRTKEEAEAHIPSLNKPKPRKRNPYDYWH